MKSLFLICICSFLIINSNHLLSQVEEGENTKIPVIDKAEEPWELREDEEDEEKKNEAHWAGFDIGFGILLNDKFSNEFEDNVYWENEIGKSLTMSFNFFEYKIPIYRHFFGLTTGIGFGFSIFDLKDNYVLAHNADTVYAVNDPIQNYKTNYLSVVHFSIPLLLEFAAKKTSERSFYFSAGVVGSVRVGSSMTLKGKYDNGDKFNNQTISKFQLNPFTVDGVVRTGYYHFGGFVAYNLLPLFKKDKTVPIHPIRFGLSYNF